ncbi:TadE/TadG family type IV pilus assembly protein [Celeribacter neptunius]|uniref:Flp pilus assembly protein TadG n=1 Tax=Celeribacter neptunius TaxID=588602 RepID=A0A1I3IN45_9RHOB|nr:TadE/TadG family type IV pilus assembly protein [Celeribacter neptunius]SFI49404.1 Flp pilus assembly protein TadG [Celeribacter neptunius]
MLGTDFSCKAANEKGMHARDAKRSKARPALWRLRQRYIRDERGSLTVFGLFTFVIILLLAGMGIDIMRQETLRAELQNTLDRSVLAAANLDSTLDAEAVVTDYFAKAGLLDYLASVETVTSGDGRSVTARVSADLPTYFMRYAGINDLSFKSHGTAEQGLANLEISLVLDVSNSMNSNNKFYNLTIAAEDFADTIFANSAEGAVSVSVVPYSTQVNAGATILGEFNIADRHDTSYCINFGATDFSTTAIDTATLYHQTMHFDPWYYTGFDNGLRLQVCDPDSGNNILPLSDSLDTIKSKIAGLSADGNTSIDLGVKWGAALLDSSAQTLTSALVTSGEVSAGMSDRPYDSSNSSLKVMVVMTDGVNTTQYYMPDSYRTGYSDIYQAADGKLSFETRSSACYYSHCWYVPSTGSYVSSVWGGNNAVQLTWEEVWSRITVENHAYTRYQASRYSSDYYFWTGATRVGVNNATKNARLDAICSAAKEKGILVFTIGFEAPTDAEAALKSCASSDAHYYDVDGLEIADAFSAIATKVTELRLVE